MDQTEHMRHRAFKAGLYGELGRIGKALASPQRLELLDLLTPRLVRREDVRHVFAGLLGPGHGFTRGVLFALEVLDLRDELAAIGRQRPPVVRERRRDDLL